MHNIGRDAAPTPKDTVSKLDKFLNSESTMLLANKEAVMTVLDTLNFVAFNPLQNNNTIAFVVAN